MNSTAKVHEDLVRRLAVRRALANRSGLPLPLRVKVEQQRVRAILRGKSDAGPDMRAKGWSVSPDGRVLSAPGYARFQTRDSATMQGIVWH